MTEEELEKASSGKIINLISVDTFRLSEICAYLHFVWPELFLTIIITIVLLFRVLGLSAVAGVSPIPFMIVFSSLTRPFAAYRPRRHHPSSSLRIQAILRLPEEASRRRRRSTEPRDGSHLLGSDRQVLCVSPICATTSSSTDATPRRWEEKFLEMMAVTRAKELDALWQRAITMVYSGVLTFGAPVIVAVATFVFHTKYLGLDLDAETAFTALALFNILRGPLEGFTDSRYPSHLEIHE